MARVDQKHKPDKRQAAAIRRALLRWYDAHHRPMPWRVSPADAARVAPNPYHALVSEAMLQQTQVATVLPYFERFVERWPTIHDLASADEQDVLTQWQGLGYYRRARSLHAAAKAVVNDHDGDVPNDVAQLLTLPGVGRYTAGAVASIVFGRRAPILDGNVARVLSRWFAIEDSIDEPVTRDRLWSLAERLLPKAKRLPPQAKPPIPSNGAGALVGRITKADTPVCPTSGRVNPCGDFNQAMMELGALVCTPKRPTCLTCPVRAQCVASLRGNVEDFPQRSNRVKVSAVEHHVLAVARRGRWLIQQRPDGGLWAGMWQLPTAESLDARADSAAVSTWASGALGLQTDDLNEVDRFVHQTTHRRITFVVWRPGRVTGRVRRDGGRWCATGKLGSLPMSNAQRRIVSAVTKPR